MANVSLTSSLLGRLLLGGSLPPPPLSAGPKPRSSCCYSSPQDKVAGASRTRCWLDEVVVGRVERCGGSLAFALWWSRVYIYTTHSLEQKMAAKRVWTSDDRNSGLSLNKKAKKGIEDPSSVVIYSLGRSNWGWWERSYTTVTRSRARSTITWPRGYSSGDVTGPWPA